jgi:hypothetical protein
MERPFSAKRIKTVPGKRDTNVIVRVNATEADTQSEAEAESVRFQVVAAVGKSCIACLSDEGDVMRIMIDDAGSHREPFHEACALDRLERMKGGCRRGGKKAAMRDDGIAR